MNKLDLKESKAGLNIRGEFRINNKNIMLDIFIRKETSIENIEITIREALLKQSYSLIDSTENDIKKYAKIIFHNIKSFGAKQTTKHELSKPKKIVDEIIEFLEEKNFEETIYPVRSEIKISIGRRDDIQKFINTIIIILTKMDVESIESISYVDTEIIISGRMSFDPRNETDFFHISTLTLRQIIHEHLYKELIKSITEAAKIADKLLQKPEALSILNQMFEKQHGFSYLKDVKRIKDKKFNELMEQLNSYLEMMK
jgi:hypothetical protein